MRGECKYCGANAADDMCERCALREESDEHIAELQTEVQQLKHELRKYEPSDAMMVVLLQRDDCIREAARLLRPLETAFRRTPVSGADSIAAQAVSAWLAHPTVQRAVASPLADKRPLAATDDPGHVDE